MARKLGFAAALVAVLLLASAAFAQRSHRGGRSYSGGGHYSGRAYSGGGARSYSGGGYYSGRHYYGGGYSRGGGGRYYGYGRGPRFSFGIGIYTAPRYYYRAPYRYRYYPGPCEPPGFYDWEGYWHYYPGCAVVVYPPPPYVVAPYPY